MSNKTTVKVQYVNQPKEGKKKGSIKTVDGKYFFVWPDKLGEFAVGRTYDIEYETSEFKGKEYATVKSIKASSTTESTNGNGYTANPNEGVHWGGCLKCAAIANQGGAISAEDLIIYARKLFVAEPIVEAAKEIFNAKEATAANGDEAPTDW